MAINLGNMEIVIVAAENNFRDEELFIPEDIFSAAGAFVQVASTTTDTIYGMLGGTIKPDIRIDKINTDSLNALVIAGGSGSVEYLWGNEALLKKVREAYDKGKVIGAICLSAVIPAQAGIMKGRRGTVYPTVESLSELKRHGEVFVDKGLVVSDRIVTAQGPAQAKDFANAVLELAASRATLAE